MASLPKWVRTGIILSGPLALAVLGAVALATSKGGGPEHGPTPVRLEGTDVWGVGQRPAPGFSFHDQNAREISRGGLRGRVWAVTFLDSRCTLLCPVTARELETTERLLGPNYQLTVVVISVLPGYDTPPHVRRFVERVGLTGDWHWLTGSTKEMRPVWARYGIEVITRLQHTAAVYLVDRRGDIRVADGVPFLPAQLAASVRALEAHTTG